MFSIMAKKITKKQRLLDSAKKNKRKPRVSRLKDEKPWYRFGVCVYPKDKTKVDALTEQLRDAGVPRANRSMVIQLGIRLLHDELGSKSPDAVLKYVGQQERK